MEKNKFLKLTPMLLQEIDESFDSDKHLYEIKFDGLRALIYINKDEIIIKSRRNIILNDIYPELLKIKKMTKDTCILDGEIVLMEDDKPSFSRLQERTPAQGKTLWARVTGRFNRSQYQKYLDITSKAQISAGCSGKDISARSAA